jgi:hypothetical protein
MFMIFSDSFSRSQKYDKGRASTGWHADITFEPIPSDYAVGVDSIERELPSGLILMNVFVVSRS